MSTARELDLLANRSVAHGYFHPSPGRAWTICPACRVRVHCDLPYGARTPRAISDALRGSVRRHLDECEVTS